MNWIVKITAKILFSRLSIPYSAFKFFGIFRHGKMDDIEYAYKIFSIHFHEFKMKNNILYPKVLLELGCGDSIASAVIAASQGIKKVYLVDVGSFACKDVAFYRELTTFLKQKGLNPPDILSNHKFEDILKLCNATYLTNGLKSLSLINDEEIDFVYSHSVLEHIRKHELGKTLSELYRIMKPGGFASHTIDYQDHLAKGLNNLRFPEKVWESYLFSSSGFYTNRVPAVTMHRLFLSSGFTIIDQLFGRWEELPTKRKYISKEFNIYNDDELLNRTSSIFIKK